MKCPDCESHNVMKIMTGIELMGGPFTYRCKDCGNRWQK